jgi:signal transduction histidine kinase/DNA-binding response OmpR family regulator
MKFFFTSLFSIFFLSNAFAQKEKDSLLNIWYNIRPTGSTTFYAMINLVEDHYLFKKPDSALVISNQMLDLAKKQDNVKFEIEAHSLIGKVYFQLKKFPQGEKIYTEGLELAMKTKDSFLYAEKLFRLGYMYAKYDDYTNAYKTLKKSQELYRILGDGLNEGWSIAHQGFIYRDLGDYKEAEKYHKEHLQLSIKYGIKQSISGAYGNLGEVYYKLGELTKSIEHWEKAIGLSKEIGLEEYASVGTGKLLEIYINEKKFSEATKYLEEYKTVTGQFSTPKYTRNFSMNIHLWQCQIDYGLGNYTEALKECEDCLKIFKANNWTPESILLKNLYEINKKLDRHAIALDYLEQYHVLTDDEKVDKARTEIQNIAFNNQIVADSLNQAEEKRVLNAAYQEELQKKHDERNLFLIIGLIVFLIATAYIVISRKIAASERKRHIEMDQTKNALFTNITHEFRTPLTVIKGMTGSIKSNLDNRNHDDIEHTLEIIDRNSDSLLHLINEMLDLAKIESGNMELNLVQADIIPFTKYLTQSFHSLAEEKNINFTIKSKIEKLEMDFDVNKFKTIITNLLSNAIKFTPKKGEVLVHLDRIQEKNIDYFLLDIKDSGLGISKKDQLHIFDRFYQVDNTSSRLEKGTGIGLSLVKEFVELMNGTIQVESAHEEGSRFRVKIPVTNNAVFSDGSEIVSTSSISKSSVAPIELIVEQTLNEADKKLPLVLIVEDNLDVAHYIKTCLKGKYQIEHALNGALGIKMALEKIPDVIISDVMMPEKDGFELCEHLKTDELTDHIPIIMLTAKATFEDRLTGLSHGADAYITKPFEKAELLTRIDQLILLREKMLSKFEKTGIDRLLNENIKNSEAKFLNKIITVIHDNIIETDFGPVQLALQLHLSESQLYRKLKATSGKSTALFIRSIRLQKGKELIQTTDKTISEVAFEVGFNDPSYFSRAFKEEFGQSPSATSK